MKVATAEVELVEDSKKEDEVKEEELKQKAVKEERTQRVCCWPLAALHNPPWTCPYQAGLLVVCLSQF